MFSEKSVRLLALCMLGLCGLVCFTVLALAGNYQAHDLVAIAAAAAGYLMRETVATPRNHITPAPSAGGNVTSPAAASNAPGTR